MKIESDDDHCWPGVGFVSLGTDGRSYVRDPSGHLGDLPVGHLYLDAKLPKTATDTGWSH